MVARFVPSNVAEMVDWLAGTITAQTGMILNIGAGGASGDLVFKTNTAEAARFLFGSAGPPGTAGALLFNHGDTQTIKTLTTGAGRYLDIRQGTAASPDADYVPPIKVSRTFAHAATAAGTNALNSATVNVTSTTGFASSGTFYLNGVATAYTGKTATSFTGCGNHAATTTSDVIADYPLVDDGAEQLAAIVGVDAATGSGGTQSVGVFGGATNSSGTSTLGLISPDACGVYGHGRILSGGNGVAAGGCFVGYADSGSSATITATQVFSNNFTASDASYSATAISHCGFWVNAGGLKNSGAAMLIRGASPHRFDVGIGFMGGSSAGIVSASIRDDSSSTTSIVVNGTHTTGIDLSGGTFSGPPLIVPNNKAINGKNAAGDANRVIGFIDSSDNVVIGDSGATAVKFGIHLDLTGRNIATDTSTGTKIGTSTTQKLGFFNATPVVQPAATTDLRTALIQLGLYASGGATPLSLNGGDLTAAAIQGTTITISAQANALAMNSQKITGLAAGSATGEAVTWPLPLFGELLNAQVFGPGANQTWTNPNTGTIACVLVHGGGGGGGGGVNSASAGNPRSGGAGGGGGGWLAFAVPIAALGSTCNVNVASGGAGGTAGNAGSDANRTTAFDSAGGNGNVTAATGGGAGASGASTGGSGGTATAPTYSGYAVTSVATNGGAGGNGTTAASAGANGTTNGGGAGGGCSTTPTGQNGGTGAVNSFTSTAAGSAGTGGASSTRGAPSLANLFVGAPNVSMGGGGGGGCHTNGTGASRGADGFGGGGAGGGGSCVNGSAGVGGTGGDGVVIVLVY